MGENDNPNLGPNNDHLKVVELKKEIIVPAEFSKWLEENKNDFVLVPAAQLETLLNNSAAKDLELTEANKERQILIKIAYSIMDLFGFIDNETGKMKPEIISGEESFIPGMLKSLGDVTTLLMSAKTPFKSMREKAEQKLAEKFSFVKDLIPLLQKYSK